MEFKTYNEVEECRKLWNLLSPKKRLFDVWDYRSCFYDEKDSIPHFIVGYENEEIAGVLPLVFAKSKNQYNYFGGWFPERNSFFLKDKAKIPEFLEKCPNNTFIEGIEPNEGIYYKFLDDEYTYFLDLEKYDSSFEKYFGSFEKKRQKNFNSELRKVPQHRIYCNKIEDFGRLVDLNVSQYGEDSKFNDESIKNGMHKMVNLALKRGILDMTSLEINGRIEAVDVGIFYNEWYYAVIGGANNQKIPNLGKLITIIDIKNAIAKKARFVDFAATSGHWKEMWNLDREMLLKFVK